MVNIASGLPVWVRSDRDNSLTGVGFDRPDLAGNPVREHANRDGMIDQFFDIAAFVPNQPGRYGNAGRNLFSGPAQSTTDLSLTKNFLLSEKLGRLQFRTEFFNLFNHPNFDFPERICTVIMAGTPCSANAPFGSITRNRHAMGPLS